jgi:hypothetical protein
MTWERPTVAEIKMDAEIGSYQPDDFRVPTEAFVDLINVTRGSAKGLTNRVPGTVHSQAETLAT